MSRGRDDDYVGYCNPPREHQFKKGDDRPRPKRSRQVKNPLLLLEDVLREEVSVKVGGEAQRMSRQRALLYALRKKVLESDPRALRLWQELMSQVPAAAEPTDYSAAIGRVRKLVDERLEQSTNPQPPEIEISPEELRRRQKAQQDQIKREALGAWYKRNE